MFPARLRAGSPEGQGPPPWYQGSFSALIPERGSSASVLGLSKSRLETVALPENTTHASPS